MKRIEASGAMGLRLTIKVKAFDLEAEDAPRSDPVDPEDNRASLFLELTDKAVGCLARSSV